MPAGNSAQWKWTILVAVVAALVFATVAWAIATESWNPGALARTLAWAGVYMVPLMALRAAVEPFLRRRAAPTLWSWLEFTAVVAAVACVAAAAGSYAVLVLGLEQNAHDLNRTNRLVVGVTVLASLAMRFFTETKERLETRNRQLEERVAADRKVLEVQQQDFERAREIQQALMPKQLPRITGGELAAGWQPARVVGGDYFDAVRLGDSSVVIAIGDVSGKGMSAALLMSNLQAIVRAFAAESSPAALCARANELISGNVAPGKFITFFCGVADMACMRFDYCSAGHNPPILCRKNGQVERLTEGGPVLGVFPAARYPAGTVGLRSGDRLALFTDGISEAMNEVGEEFGEERLLALLTQDRAGGAGPLHNRIMAEVTAFCSGTFQDDATLLVLAVD
jgi:serine phosphatase RsbU (regulator of sigma subunit)